jgi:hypothetical protein
MATQDDIDKQRYSIKDVFELVNFAIGPYFHGKMATVIDDGNKTQIPLTDFVLRCVAEEMIERWTGDDDNKKKVVETTLEKGNYEDYVVPTGEMGALGAISGGRRGRSIGSRKTRRRHK